MPSGTGFEEAAPLTDGAFNALWCLRQAGVLEGRSVLIYGGSGAIGTAAVQLARHFGGAVVSLRMRTAGALVGHHCPTVRHRRNRRAGRRAAEPLEDDDPGLVELPSSVERAYEVWEVRRALAQLPPEDAELVRRQHLEGLTQSEVAQRIGLPLGTVKSRTFRAHRRLAGLPGHLRDDPAVPQGEGRRARLTEGHR